MTKTEQAKVFSCRCSMNCEKGVPWFSRAPMAECNDDDEPCRGLCHKRQQAFSRTRDRLAGDGQIVSGFIASHISGRVTEKPQPRREDRP